MKKRIKTLAASMILSLISVSAFSQDDMTPAPAWVSDKGHWVVETNIKSPKDHIIWFYNNDNVLVYKETLTGIKLNPQKRATKMKLKRILESSVIAWEKTKKSSEEQSWVKIAL